MNKYTIWQNHNLNLDDYRENLIEVYGEQSEDELTRLMYEENTQQLHDEMAAQLMPDGAGWNHEWREKLATKQNEMNQIKEAITQDIRHEAQAVAEAKNLEVIFAEYRANISAQDVTNDILQKLGTNPKEVSNSGK